MSYLQAVLIGALQGFAELFPISSLGHTVLIPAILGWKIDRSSDEFVAFLVLTHLATALVLLGFFWRDWLGIVAGILRSLARREIDRNDTYARLGWLLVISTVPAGILGLLFEEELQQLFADARLVAAALALNGLVLFGVERLRRHQVSEGPASDAALSQLPWRNAVWIGLAQSLALIPGFSRTGLAMGGGLACRLSHANAARYAFFLATPIILAAAVLKVPDLFGDGAVDLTVALAGALAAAVTAFLSVRFLVRYFETETLMPFATYCVAAGIAVLGWLILVRPA